MHQDGSPSTPLVDPLRTWGDEDQLTTTPTKASQNLPRYLSDARQSPRMGNHPFNIIVILFWLATMTWLVVAKVLPPLRVGEPPTYGSILKDREKSERPACWSARFNDQSVGWAATKTVRRKDGTPGSGSPGTRPPSRVTRREAGRWQGHIAELCGTVASQT